jgi:hypothetical protein
MTRNVGTLDRVFRGLGAVMMIACAFLAPLPATIRMPVFLALAAYLLFTAFSGTCFGYLVMGRSTCPVSSR